VVGGLVEQQRLGVGEEDAGELHAAALTSREGAQRLGEHAVGQAERRADARRLALGGVPAERGELVLQLPVATDGSVPLGLVGRLGHRDLCLDQPGTQHVQAAPGQHPVARGDVEVAAAGVLRQIADLAGDLHLPRVREPLSGQRGQRRRLTGTVAPHQADAVAGLHAQGRVADEDAGAGTEFEAGRRDH